MSQLIKKSPKYTEENQSTFQELMARFHTVSVSLEQAYAALKEKAVQLSTELEKERKKNAAGKDGNKMRLPRHYEPKGLI